MNDFKSMKELQGDMYSQGQRMGFAKGGQVKDTGLMPASKGCTEQEKEAGGHGKLMPGYKKGGKAVHKGKAKLAAKGVKAVNEAKKVLGGQITEKEAARLKKGKGKPVHKSKPMFGKGGRSC